MNALELHHEDYSGVVPEPVKNENGDLNRMLYSFYGELEENYDYNLFRAYSYANDAESVEDGWIITENPGGAGTLLMFRDSFANTLIPFLSNEFETVCYYKGEPNALERYVESCAPDNVVIEKVERNISNYLENPPILMPPEAELSVSFTIANIAATVLIEECINDINYFKISGTADQARMSDDSEILVKIGGHIYRAYQNGENGYMLYLKKDILENTSESVQIYIVSGDNTVQVLSETVELP